MCLIFFDVLPKYQISSKTESPGWVGLLVSKSKDGRREKYLSNDEVMWETETEALGKESTYLN